MTAGPLEHLRYYLAVTGTLMLTPLFLLHTALLTALRAAGLGLVLATAALAIVLRIIFYWPGTIALTGLGPPLVLPWLGLPTHPLALLAAGAFLFFTARRCYRLGQTMWQWVPPFSTLRVLPERWVPDWPRLPGAPRPKRPFLEVPPEARAAAAGLGEPAPGEPATRKGEAEDRRWRPFFEAPVASDAHGNTQHQYFQDRQ